MISGAILTHLDTKRTCHIEIGSVSLIWRSSHHIVDRSRHQIVIGIRFYLSNKTVFTSIPGDPCIHPLICSTIHRIKSMSKISEGESTGSATWHKIRQKNKTTLFNKSGSIVNSANNISLHKRLERKREILNLLSLAMLGIYSHNRHELGWEYYIHRFVEQS